MTAEQRTMRLQIAAWGLAALTTILSLLIWGQLLDWNFSNLSAYGVFPVLGLIAFGLMWGHYAVAVYRQQLRLPKSSTKQYFEVTSLIVLACILLHPGLLIFQLWNDGFGLPPGSYLEHYVAPSLKWAALLGSLSLIIFLSFELRHWFSKASWWRYIGYLNDIAMIAILIHGFRLGTHLQSGWFRAVWIGYTITLLAFIGILYSGKYKRAPS